jgi:sulfoxide reductase heme-binding subunit YedZ
MGRFSWLKAATFALLFVPALVVLVQWQMDLLRPLPIRAATHEIGRWSIRLIFLTLAVTPLGRILKAPRLFLIRRMLGVGSFAYLFLHLSLYALDQNFDLAKVASEIALRIYLTIGFVALLGFAALAATSTDAMVRRLGPKRWRRLHALIFPLTLLGIVHFFMQAKLEVYEPTWMAGLFGWLLAWRGLTRLGRAPLGWLSTAALAVAAGLVTALGEALYAWAKVGAPPALVLAANLDFSFGPTPAWIALAVAAVVPVLALARKLLPGRAAGA